MIKDATGDLWLANYKGLYRIDKETKNIHHFNIRDGLAKRAYTSLNLFLDDKGEIWILTNGGVTKFDPDNIWAKTPASTVHIEAIRLFGETERAAPYKKGNGLELPYDENYLSFKYVGISMRNNSHVTYKYMLKGFDDDWNITNEPGWATYNNLPPGEYELILYATNSSGEWGSEPLTYTVIVNKPYWQEWWFAATLAIAGISIIVLVIAWRERRIRRRAAQENEIQKTIADLEIRALRAQMNPHFIFNALNAIQESILKKDVDRAYTYLAKFSRLLRLILEGSSENFITLEKEINTLKLYLDIESLRFDERFSYHIFVDEEVDQTTTKIPSLLVQPVVENAIWHGLLPSSGDCQVWICFRESQNELICTVEDNGVGRAFHEGLRKAGDKIHHQSKGLSLITDRIEALRKAGHTVSDMRVSDRIEAAEPKGTLVEIVLPLNI